MDFERASLTARILERKLNMSTVEAEVARRLNGERLMLLAWSRAILLQMAHPLVAVGIDEHSTFRTRPWSAAARLHHTVRAMLALTFADAAGQEQALEGIRRIHRRINGTLPSAAGIFAAGTRYSAEDPALVLWVHATLVESIPLVYDLLVAPLPESDRDAYCADAAGTAIALGARPDDVPRTWSAACAHLEAGYRSGAIVVTDAARRMAGTVLAPAMSQLVLPLRAINRTLTVGLLPAVIREQYGFTWTAGDARTFAWTVRGIRRLRPHLPARVALWPEAR